MSKDNKPLPKPPSTPFGRKRKFEQQPGLDTQLIANKLTMAAATGNLDNFMKKEFDGNEQAMAMSMMMLGMTGMTPDAMPDPQPTQKAQGTQPTQGTQKEPEIEVPEDARQAMESGDMEELKVSLGKEHARRQAIAEKDAGKKPAKAGKTKKTDKVAKAKATSSGKAKEPAKDDAPAGDEKFIEREVLDQLIKIAKDNEVSLDWVMARALRLYTRDYKATGRM